MNHSHLSSRVQRFLLGNLQKGTAHQYRQALAAFSSDLVSDGVAWHKLCEEERDAYLADHFVGLAETPGASLGPCSVLLAALHKITPHHRYRASGKVLEAWRAGRGIRQAPAMPETLVNAIAALSLAAENLSFGTLAKTCFAGLLRVGEALALRPGDCLFVEGRIILVLRQTKRGLQEKVLIDDRCTVLMLRALWKRNQHMTLLFAQTSYSRAMRHLRLVSKCLGVEAYGFTSHSWRRGGASSRLLAGQGIDDICVLGRWASLRSARLYIRRGEVFLNEFTAKTDGELGGRLCSIARCLPLLVENLATASAGEVA